MYPPDTGPASKRRLATTSSSLKISGHLNAGIPSAAVPSHVDLTTILLGTTFGRSSQDSSSKVPVRNPPVTVSVTGVNPMGRSAISRKRPGASQTSPQNPRKHPENTPLPPKRPIRQPECGPGQNPDRGRLLT